ncbi:MAG TPA: pyridoxal phosphate-dependent aminotransferase [Thermoanaerobaculia bacterium]|nr:pyridoxal phosphate-dependent aminotransferase [Thermoanaerobaculia bacterium]
MKPRLSDRVQGFAQSDIRRMSRECERVGGINLGQGICDLPTESLVREGAIDAIENSLATYSKFEGIDPLREKIASKVASYNQYEVDPDREIVVTVGSTGGFACAALATLNSGDEVILFEPYYGYHRNTLKALGVTSRLVPLNPPDWGFDAEQLRAAFGPRTRAIVICTPSNPSGKVFSREELLTVGRLCEEAGAWIITDEIYEYIIYDDRKHVSAASLPELRDRTITMSGFSKTFSVTGWRIGYVTAPPEVAAAIGLMNDLFYVCAPTPLQWGIARGLDVDASYYAALRDDYEGKRNILADALRAGGMAPFIPQGAYYMLADVKALGFGSSRDAANDLLATTGVASVPGTAFFDSPVGETLVRFCFAKDPAPLETACERLGAYRRLRAR